jgi:hypothetical protein
MTPSRVVVAFAVMLLVLDVAGIVLLADSGSWDPFLFLSLLALVVGSNIFEVEFGGNTITGEGLGLVLGMALLGPAPAAALGVAAGVTWLLRRPRREALALLGVAEMGALALAGGLVLREAAEALAVDRTEPAYAIVVLAGFGTFLVLNVIILLWTNKLIDGDPFWASVRTTVMPLLPSQVAMVLLASIIVWAEAHLGAVAFSMSLALFVLYVYLLRELVLSQSVRRSSRSAAASSPRCRWGSSPRCCARCRCATR